ncbi:methyltransferase [Mycolicibacter heraklionensis]|uniref:Methyltransferase n=1 Tax=Mycolicibacter heraklionensis TaxID=512402 RepID=A0A9X7WGJ8_9MYCO|nr:class I SAM-dependent methyltransferase [Mycolicibacter heraklionensis]KLO29073.1 methyltransferase [Mycolicibacter heraklionensis]QZA07726.1 class I SAM-dependent methyltransferase [Mycolicibacter heraklionensis]
MGKVQPDLGEVQETLLIPLYGRARDNAKRHPILHDARAAELVDDLDYDFARFRGGSLPGSVLRTAIFDVWVRQFLRDHPSGTVVEIGTGLNTRFERVDNGRLRWFDLDLPDTIELRRRYFADTERRTMLAGSVLETDWFDAVAAAPAPYLFVAEAVLLYFPEDQARGAIRNLAARFPGSHLVVDTGGRKMIENQHRNGAMKALTARMKWVCDDPRELDTWGMELLDSRTLATPQPELATSLPARYRYGLPALARIAPGIVNAYRFNLFRLGNPS